MSEILARRRDRQDQMRQVLPPDFTHGNVAVGSIYEVLGGKWAQRALFAVDDGDVVTTAYFDDYFLVLEQWEEDSAVKWDVWWEDKVGKRDRVITMGTGGQKGRIESSKVELELERRSLRCLEVETLGVVRESGCRGKGKVERRRCGEIDVLSLVAMTSHLCDVKSSLA